VKLTIGIKALNEQAHIAAALSSAIEAARPFNGEVLLADSGSTDKTLEIARKLPVRIVQLADVSQRCCGAGAQLAFQNSTGEYFYLLDGDMVIMPDFLPAAIAFLESNPGVAGVGGRVREMITDGHEFQIRAKTTQSDHNWLPGSVDSLDCGGLYRVSAIKVVGYFADRNLHAFEEFDLAARLKNKGLDLARINITAVNHYGHKMEGYRLLWQRMASGYASASGEILRAAIGRPHLIFVLRNLAHIRYGLLVICWWSILGFFAFAPLPIPNRIIILLILAISPILFLIYRRRSWTLGLYSFVAWNVNALGLIIGIFRSRISPESPLATIDVRTCPENLCG
jgi:glycosyltransferase involved in cell wall biosynthesis